MCVLCMFVSFVNLYTVSQKSSTEGMVGSIIWILLEIYLSFQQWKNFENPLRID